MRWESYGVESQSSVEQERRTCWAEKRGNGVSFSKPRTPLYHRIHKFKSSVVKSIVDLGVNSRFIHSDPDLIRTHFMASTTPPQIAVAVVRHLSSSNLALL